MTSMVMCRLSHRIAEFFYRGHKGRFIYLFWVKRNKRFFGGKVNVRFFNAV